MSTRAQPLVVDEAPACGGQIYRQRLVPDERDGRALYGSQAGKAERLHQAFAALEGRIDYWPRALVWNLGEAVADIAVAGVNRRMAYDGLVLATGATDRGLPVPGRTLPGVFDLAGCGFCFDARDRAWPVIRDRAGRASFADIDAVGRLRGQAPVKSLPLCLAPDAGLEAAE
jgi:hypothetical protein